MSSKSHKSAARSASTQFPYLATDADEHGPIESFGSVEGKLEGLNVHEHKIFYVWEALTGRRVQCNFADRIPLDDVLAAVTKRVAARGIVRRRRTGELVSVQAEELRVFPAEDELPRLGDVLGITHGD